MSRKAFRVVVDLEIQAVTCPGVWLCPNGNVQLLFSMLGQEVQTKRLPPVFPLLFHEKITFQKTFSAAGCLAEVQNALGQEDVYAVLLQETDNNGYVTAIQLARFRSTALNILFPSPCSKGLLAGVDVDLLMEPSADYPGILSPKIELSTRTTIAEVTNLKPEGFIINPKMLCSQKSPFSSHHDNQTHEANAHSIRKYHQQIKGIEDKTSHRVTSRLNSSARKCLSTGPNANAHSDCPHLHASPADLGNFYHYEKGHLSSVCPLCTRYKAIFSSMTDFPDDTQEKATHGKLVGKKAEQDEPGKRYLENTRRLSTALHAHVDRILEPPISNILNTLEQPQHCFVQHFHNNPHVYGNEKQTLSEMESKRRVNPRSPDNFTNIISSKPQSGTSCGDGTNFNSSRQLFYANLEKFYRKLYARAKSRAEAELNLSGAT